MRLCRRIAPFLLAAITVFAQRAAKLEFEAASVRPSEAPAEQNHVDVGLRIDGSQAHIASLPLRDYIAMAYRVKPYQINGPDWIASEKFDLSAKLPAGSNSDEIPEMIQSFLADRFQLKFHREQKELPVYALLLGKPPLKLQKSAPDAAGTNADSGRTVTASGGAEGVSVNLGRGSYYTFKDGNFEIKKVTMNTLAQQIERYLDRPMLNLTGLDGEYDLSFAVTPEDYQAMLIRAAVNSGLTLPPQALRLMDNGSIASLSDGLQKAGLKLDARKSPLEMIVIDEMLKSPKEN